MTSQRDLGLIPAEIHVEIKLVIILYMHWYHLVCPHCSADQGRSLSRIRLGPGREACSMCLREYRGSKEWPDMSLAEKLEYILPPTVSVYLGLATLLGITGIAVGNGLEDRLIIGGICLGTLSAPVFPCLAMRAWSIWSSWRRYLQRSGG